ncbi:MAG: hypothetical protein R6W82_05500 [bacterium]
MDPTPPPPSSAGPVTLLLCAAFSLCWGAGPCAAQSSHLPLPDRDLLERRIRSFELAEGSTGRLLRTPRLGWLMDRDDPWSGEAVRLMRPPDGPTPVRVRVEGAVHYFPPAPGTSFRELRLSEELPLLSVRGMAAGAGWWAVVEPRWRQRWAAEEHDAWNLPRTLRQSDRQVLHRALLGTRIGPFHVEMGRLGRRGGVGRTGGLLLGGDVRSFDGLAVESGGSVWGFEYLLAPLDPSMTSAEQAVIPDLGEEAFGGFEKVFLLQRLSWRPREGLTLALTEAALFYGRAPGLSDVLPVLSQHDQYRDYDNLAWGLDARWYPMAGFGAYGEVMLDDLRVPTLEGGGSDPSAFGFLAGIEGRRGAWEGFVECVYTSDRLYRFEHPLGRWSSRLRFGSLTRSWIPDHDQPLGHWLGPDASGLFLGMTRVFGGEDPRRGEGRGLLPPGRPRLSLLVSRRLHRTLPEPPGPLPRPIPLTDPAGPYRSRTALTVTELGFVLPPGIVPGIGVEAVAVRTHLVSEALEGPPPGPGPDRFERWLTELRLGIAIPLL